MENATKAELLACFTGVRKLLPPSRLQELAAAAGLQDFVHFQNVGVQEADKLFQNCFAICQNDGDFMFVLWAGGVTEPTTNNNLTPLPSHLFACSDDMSAMCYNINTSATIICVLNSRNLSTGLIVPMASLANPQFLRDEIATQTKSLQAGQAADPKATKAHLKWLQLHYNTIISRAYFGETIPAVTRIIMVCLFWDSCFFLYF